MPPHIDPTDPKYRQAAAEILRRHDNGEPEANITSAVRGFLTVTGLVKDAEIVEENPPAQGSRRAVDLTALDTFIEFKRRIGTKGGFDPDPVNVRQLDDYLEASQKDRRVRMGVLTDGKHWLLRWPGAGPVRTVPPYAFTFDDPDRWVALHDWLRDHALSAEEDKQPSRGAIGEHFGPNSPSYQRDIATLKALYDRYAEHNTIKVKRELWRNLLTAALGEIARTDEQLDNLFVRHTYLTAVIGMVVQARFGGDIVRLAANDPADLVLGRDFRNKTGLQGVVESDFFAWPTEVGGLPFLKTLARRIARFDWPQAPNDVAAILYETVIPPDERRQLGEYYTPDWLARAIVREVVTDPYTSPSSTPPAARAHSSPRPSPTSSRPRGKPSSTPRSSWSGCASPSPASTSTPWRSTWPAPPGSWPPSPRFRPPWTSASPPRSPFPSTWATPSSSAPTAAPSSPGMRSRFR